MRFSIAALLLLTACAPGGTLGQEAVMPVIAPTDTLRAEFSQADFDASTGVLRLAGRILARGPQTAGWTEAVGANITLRPPDQTDWSSGSPFIPVLMRKPHVILSAGRSGAFEFGAVTPNLDGYQLDFQWVGSFGLSVRVDSLVASM